LPSVAQQGKVINDRNAQKRDVRGFHGIEIGGGIDLYLSQGTEEAVAVSAADPADRDLIRTDVDNGVLKIHMDRSAFSGIHWGNRHLKAYVSCKDLDKLHASGGSDVYIQDIIKSGQLSVDLSGGSDLRGKLNVQRLSVYQSGGADSYIDGTAGELHIEASGGSDFHGYDLQADNCDVHASGGSDVHVNVNKELRINTSGGSDVYYKGNGMIRESHTSGGGEVHRKD
jgi:hypothetical protein